MISENPQVSSASWYYGVHCCGDIPITHVGPNAHNSFSLNVSNTCIYMLITCKYKDMEKQKVWLPNDSSYLSNISKVCGVVVSTWEQNLNKIS